MSIRGVIEGTWIVSRKEDFNEDIGTGASPNVIKILLVTGGGGGGGGEFVGISFLNGSAVLLATNKYALALFGKRVIHGCAEI